MQVDRDEKDRGIEEEMNREADWIGKETKIAN
jgi:hypothetical protein